MKIKRGIQQHKRHKKVLRLTKGFKLGRKNLYRLAHQALLKSKNYAYRDRRNKKRDARRLWIVQINAALKAREMRYRDFIYGLNKAGLELDRKVLAELSIESPDQFNLIADKAKKACQESTN